MIAQIKKPPAHRQDSEDTMSYVWILLFCSVQLIGGLDWIKGAGEIAFSVIRNVDNAFTHWWTNPNNEVFGWEGTYDNTPGAKMPSTPYGTSQELTF